LLFGTKATLVANAEVVTGPEMALQKAMPDDAGEPAPLARAREIIANLERLGYRIAPLEKER
jgi:hypothetical protein